ncbi:hypothetical protein [Cellulomonas sp. ATA003]|uniref:hypothetical protein n=1 Tax=Cellulomonas sp. ATA003 TaxID=3073064 RepID=UPI0028736DAB|nr:hypothetical protein [Cellulomonas sp. ATA003]WNB87192.1 hypothetical protein REH70_08810 [Cellulomonas sp. ATA003]
MTTTERRPGSASDPAPGSPATSRRSPTLRTAGQLLSVQLVLGAGLWGSSPWSPSC